MEALKALDKAHEETFDDAQERMNGAHNAIFGINNMAGKKGVFTGIDKVEEYMQRKASDFSNIMDELQDKGARTTATMVDKALTDAVSWMSRLPTDGGFGSDLGDTKDVTETMDKMGRAYAAAEAQKILEAGQISSGAEQKYAARVKALKEGREVPGSKPAKKEQEPQTPKPMTFSAKKVNVAEKGVLEIEDGKGNAMRFKVPRSWKKDWEKIGEALFGGKL